MQYKHVRGPPWIFMPGRGLMVQFFVFLLFFSLFSVAPHPLKIFLPTTIITNCKYANRLRNASGLRAVAS